MLSTISDTISHRVSGAISRRLVPNDEPLGRREREILLAIARTAIPGGHVIPTPDEETVDRLDGYLRTVQGTARAGYRAVLWSIELSAVVRYGRRFTKLAAPQQLAHLQGWHGGSTGRRWALRALMSPLKVAHFDDPRIFEAMRCVYRVPPPGQEERQRWKQNVVPLADMEEDETLEAEVVVIGTGAGGAVVAKELSERGVVVAMVEAGHYFGRKDFDGRPLDALKKMYHQGGMVFTLGTPPILIPSGRTVGGTTTINSGTCFRVPDRILHRWQTEHGLTELTPDAMAPYFDRVESILQVEPARWEYLGGCARVIKRGCEALGYTDHGPLKRNAPECDGQGFCCFGCPTDAKRSTNVSYVPMALRNHASLFTGAHVKEILVENGRAAGVVAEAVVGDNGVRTVRRLTIRAKAVVVSCGSYGTPTLLLRTGLANSSGQVGRNLSLHPASALLAEFDEPIMGWNAIPQGYYIHEFDHERIMFEGGFTPLDLGSAAFAFLGPEYTHAMERYNQMAAFGFMVEDTSRGRVRLGPGGRSIVTYNLNKADLDRVRRGTEILAEIFFAAGARSVYPPIHGHEIIRGFRDLDGLRRARIRASDLTMSAYHPLGTARLGNDPNTSVVGPDHQTHDVRGLYIVDGSSVPSSLGVNPQVTIMAMATRAAEIIAAGLA